MNQRTDFIPQIDHLPQQITPFIGRQQEVADVTQLLLEPSCRLLTLVGPGGIGKTRLALAVVSADVITYNRYYIPLQTLRDPTAIFPTIATILNLALSGQRKPIDQVIQYLQDKKTLLLLDNFEHLLAGAEQLSALLTQVPELKLLVTSREVLNLQEERLFVVAGLSLPPQAQMQATDSPLADAVALFTECARRVRYNFVLEDEYSGVVDICNLVEGMPLALELAAAWSKVMSCQAIAAEIRQNLDFLATRLRNIPARHRSIQAIFAQSWQMLTTAEQTIYASLSIFRGGFRREAASQVANASIDRLTAFVDKSLLHWEPTGRYQLHELLRQYAANKLATMPDLSMNTFHAHCTYYTNFLQQNAPALYGARQQELAEAIDADLDNIRVAWEWAVQQQQQTALRQLISPISYYFHQLRGRNLEGLQLLEMGLAGLNQDDPSAQENRALLLVGIAWHAIRLGQIERARSLSEQAIAIYQNEGLSLPLPNTHTSDPALTLGMVAIIRGEYIVATAHLQHALRHSQTGDSFYGNEAMANYLLADTASAQGDFAKAQAYVQAAFAIAQQTQDRSFMAYCHMELGNIAQKLGEVNLAHHHFQACYGLREVFGDTVGMGTALSRLGEIALEKDEPAQAQDFYDRSIAHFRQTHFPVGLARAYLGAGKTAVLLGNERTACQYFIDALAVTEAISFVPMTLAVLREVGQLLLEHNQLAFARSIFATVALHPATPQDVRVLVSATDATPAELAVLVAQVQRELAALSVTLANQATSVAPTQSGTAVDQAQIRHADVAIHHANQRLVEPLTPRELEVLHLLVDGLTNQAIAERLTVVVGTVKTHTNNIYSKLNVRNRVEAINAARAMGLVDNSTY